MNLLSTRWKKLKFRSSLVQMFSNIIFIEAWKKCRNKETNCSRPQQFTIFSWFVFVLKPSMYQRYNKLHSFWLCGCLLSCLRLVINWFWFIICSFYLEHFITNDYQQCFYIWMDWMDINRDVYSSRSFVCLHIIFILSELNAFHTGCYSTNWFKFE